MNSKRAGNRSRSSRAGFPYGSTGSDQTRNGTIREHVPSQRTGAASHQSWGSKASVGASMGVGSMPGAGEQAHPGSGPGPAASRKMGMSLPAGDGGAYGRNPSGASPRGMKTVVSPE